MTSLLYNLKRYRTFYLMFIPATAALVLFRYIPMAGIVIAFKDFTFMDGIWGSAWVGWDNFQRFFHNPDFWRALGNTLIISLAKLVFGFPVPVVFAILLNEVRNKHYKKVVQTISYLPHFVSWIIAAGLVYTFLSPTSGFLNAIIRALGGKPVLFIADPKYFRGILVISSIWKETGWEAIIYMAALAGVSPEMYEAATVDGASRFQKMTRITLPSIAPVVSIMLILRMGKLLEEGFEQIIAMINNSVLSVGETIQYYVYQVGLNMANNYSYAAAIGLFNSIIALCLVLTSNYIAKQINEEGGVY